MNKKNVLQSDAFVPLLSRSNSSSRLFCDVRSIHYSLELIMVVSYFKKKWDYVL